MTGLTLADVLAATGGRADAGPDLAAEVGTVTADSRAVTAGALFVALRGARHDGHDFAAAAVGAGAVAVLADRPVGVPAVVVDDVLVALGRVARARCDRLGATVIGVTGSSGKTTTKDLVAHVLAPAGPVVAPVGSFNNELGLPLTVLGAPAGTRHLVLEMSARGVGHIRWLCEVAPPVVGVVLNVGSAHLGEFGSRAVIAQAKGELVEALPDTGLAVLNADDPAVAAMAARTRAQVVTFGESAAAGWRAQDVRLDHGGRAAFRLVAPSGERADVALRYVGEHQVHNALAAAAVGGWAGLSVAEVVAQLASAEPSSRWRMEVRETPAGVTVVNDAYNANPESVRAALKTLVAMGQGRRTWAVLGAMAELGEASWAEHDAVGRLAVRLNVSRLVAVGPGAKGVHAGAELEGSWGNESAYAEDVDSALDLLRRELAPGDVVLVKGSRAAGLERLALALAPDEEVTA